MSAAALLHGVSESRGSSDSSVFVNFWGLLDLKSQQRWERARNLHPGIHIAPGNI